MRNHGSEAEVSRAEAAKEGGLHLVEVGQQHSRGPDPSQVSHSQERGLHKVGTNVITMYVLQVEPMAV